MKRFYLSSRNGISGICKYSKDFYELVLKENGYIFVNSQDSASSILSQIGSRDQVHVELGIFQRQEIEMMLLMLKANYKNVSVTMHDAPLLKFPFREFDNDLLNKTSKFYDLYIDRLKSSTRLVQKLKNIYVLSKRGVELVKKKYKVDNVNYLSHVVDNKEIVYKNPNPNQNFIYFGFIGRNKGIEYSLQIHQRLLADFPESQFYVVGQPIGKESAFYETLKKRYAKNVHYLGYVQENDLPAVFSRATFAIMPFRDYKFFAPFSGSILYSLKQGKITFTNRVNAIPELIENGKNGFYLAGNLEEDVALALELFRNPNLQDQIRENIPDYLNTVHSPGRVKSQFIF